MQVNSHINSCAKSKSDEAANIYSECTPGSIEKHQSTVCLNTYYTIHTGSSATPKRREKKPSTLCTSPSNSSMRDTKAGGDSRRQTDKRRDGVKTTEVL